MTDAVLDSVAIASDAGFDLKPLAQVIGLVVSASVPTRRAVRQLGSALALICGRVEREPTRRLYAQGLSRSAKDARHRARQLRDGEDAPPLSPADLKALKAADDLEAQAVKGRRGAPTIRANAGQQRQAVGERLKAAHAARQAAMRLAQSCELDAAREGVPADKVLLKDRGQANPRMRTRDGLKLAHEHGTFTPRDGRPPHMARIEADRLLAIGLRYRDRYEIAQPVLKSCLGGGDGKVGGKRNVWTEAKAAQRRAAVANKVRRIDMAVSAQLGGEALEALRLIAGEARTVNSITTARRRRGRLAKGLTAALRLIGDMFERGD